ncbi:IGHA1 protein, partial [Sula dactylatra]|nr:IGHA1 protein [Sula dactylatra]
SNPVIYPLISCCDECKENATFGCFISDFFPQPVTVTWVPSVQGGSKTFPALQSSNSIYKLSSDITVPAKGLDSKNFQCKAYHSATGKTVTKDIPADGANRTSEFGVRRSLRSAHSTPLPPRPQPQPDCKPMVTVTILPPSLEDLYLIHNGSITCVATNLKSATGTNFSWRRDQGKPLDVVPGKPEKLQNGLYRLTSTLKICAEEWNSGETFTCTVQSPELNEPITKSIKKDIAVSVKAPSVYVFPPPAEELARQEMATLTCLASGFRPSDILVTWTQQDRPVSPSSFITFDPKAEGDTYTVYSMLSVPAADWQRGDTFACVVGHDGIPLNFVQKNLDKTIGKPTAVNVSVVLADSDVTCY